MTAAQAFCDQLRARELEVPAQVPPGLEQELMRAHHDGQHALGVTLSPDHFAAFLGARAPAIDALAAMPLEDLYLACACAAGDDRAMALFQQRFAPEIAFALTRVPDAARMADEIAQLIFTQLLVPGATGTRGIESYRGRGSLFSWLRVISVRRALRELSSQQKETALGDEQILASMQEGPDLSYMGSLYRQAFQEAFGEALAGLDSGARSLLRQHYVHGLSIDRLSALHKIHRATAARRLAKSREELLQSTRRRMLVELRITGEELDSVMRLIASNLEASLGGLLSSSE